MGSCLLLLYCWRGARCRKGCCWSWSWLAGLLWGISWPGSCLRTWCCSRCSVLTLSGCRCRWEFEGERYARSLGWTCTRGWLAGG